MHPAMTEHVPRYYIIRAFQIGLGFDTLIICYLLGIPFILYFLQSFRLKTHALTDHIVFGFIVVAFSICLFIESADLPWFAHQQTRLTTASMQWTNTPAIMLGIVFQDAGNYPYIALFLLLLPAFYFLLRKARKLAFRSRQSTGLIYRASVFLIAGGLIFIGMRGRLSLKSPVRWGSAFISEYNYANQLGLNPVYTFIQSWLDDRNPGNIHFNLMSDDSALAFVRHFYGQKEGSNNSPVYRNVVTTGEARNFNIVLVLLESMSCYNM
jgi:hypothetical protein